MKAKKTVLVTGASSGIGKATALFLNEKGFSVYAAARRVEKMRDLEAKGVHLVEMDVTDEISMTSGVNSILAKEGSVDILVNNAGYGSYGAIEDVSLEEARRQFEVNLFGMARLIQLVLPKMRENRYGKIFNISSIGGKIYTPFGGWYHATKHAVEGFSDCLRLETQPFGVDVVIIEPGAIASEWSSIAGENLKKTSGKGAYAQAANKTADGMAKTYAGNQPSQPSVIGEAIYKAINARTPKTRYAVGYMAGTTIAMRRFLSDRLFDKIIKSLA
jgi:short-subunit dehydrogenase